MSAYASSVRFANLRVLFAKSLLPSVILARVFGLPSTPAKTAPIAKDRKAKAKVFFDSPFM